MIIIFDFRTLIETPGRIGDSREVDDGMRTFKQGPQVDRPHVGLKEPISAGWRQIEQRGKALRRYAIDHDNFRVGELRRQVTDQRRPDVAQSSSYHDLHNVSAFLSATKSEYVRI